MNKGVVLKALNEEWSPGEYHTLHVGGGEFYGAIYGTLQQCSEKLAARLGGTASDVRATLLALQNVSIIDEQGLRWPIVDMSDLEKKKRLYFIPSIAPDFDE